jgi:hypothetical protein
MPEVTLDSARMLRSSKDMAVVLALCALATLAAVVLMRLGPMPSADVSRGSEDAFTRDLHQRELPAGAGPQRWTEARARFSFRGLPLGPVTLRVEIRDARGPVTVVADGIVLGRLPSGPGAATFELVSTGRRTRDVELWSEPFRAGDGRLLGVRVGRVAVEVPARPWWPAPATLLELLLPTLLAFVAARLAGMGGGAAPTVALMMLAFECAMLWPSGLAHSAYAARLCGMLSVGSILAWAFARTVGRRRPGAAPAAFAALLAAWLVQVVAGTSPVMVVSDAVFHAHKLSAVAGGDLFPTSVTQHARPFRFPYGVSFYAVLAPLARAGIDTVALVRAGAAAAGLLATAAVFLLVLGHLGPLAAALAAVLLQLLPGAFDIAYSYGNYSNAFGQAATVLFFCWWAGRATFGWAAGAALLALAALAHFSSFVFVVTLVLALVIAELRAPDRDRTRLWAAAAGLAAAGAYYAHFTGLIWEQVPRLLEGGGQGRGVSRSAWDAARLQVLGALGQWGLPAIVLAWRGRPHPRADGRYERDLAAYWAAGLVLAVPAIVSPLEVRYLYGLTAAVALSASAGAARLEAAGGARRVAARILCIAQAALGAHAIAEAIVTRYRL